MKAGIRNTDESLAYKTAERCTILELSNDADDPEVSIARASVAPGITTAWHRLTNVAERYVILEGQGQVEVGDQSTAVTAGMVVRIPPGVRQRIRNTGAKGLTFLAICTPRFTPECYVDLEA